MYLELDGRRHLLFNSLGVDLFPKIDLPPITSLRQSRRIAAGNETEITDKVEGAVKYHQRHRRVCARRRSRRVASFITFLLEKKCGHAAQEVRNKVDLIVNSCPVTAEQPIVQKNWTPTPRPCCALRLSAALVREVTDIADKQIKQRIESISGVARLEIWRPDTRNRSLIDPDKMRAFNVTAAERSERGTLAEYGGLPAAEFMKAHAN